MIGTTEEQASPESQARNIERLLNVELEVVVRFGVTTLPLSYIVQMGTGSMIELNRMVDEPVELLVNGRLLARGEVVVIDGYYGVRILEIISPAERALSLL
jgi:flagellar motor switch protein FliN